MDVYGVDTVFDVVNKIHTIVGEMPSFKRYFIHIGFPDNWFIYFLDVYENEVLL